MTVKVIVPPSSISVGRIETGVPWAAAWGDCTDRKNTKIAKTASRRTPANARPARILAADPEKNPESGFPLTGSEFDNEVCEGGGVKLTDGIARDIAWGKT